MEGRDFPGIPNRRELLNEIGEAESNWKGKKYYRNIIRYMSQVEPWKYIEVIFIHFCFGFRGFFEYSTST